MDLISRQAAISHVDDVPYIKEHPNVGLLWKAWIESLPSAQPERKKGKWINDRGLYKCSCCNRLWTEWWAISKPIERMRKECPYCPMCGSYNGEEIDE